MSSSTVEDEDTMLPVDVHVDEDAVTGAEVDGINGRLPLVFEGPVLGPQKDQGPDWTGLIWDRTAVLVLP